MAAASTPLRTVQDLRYRSTPQETRVIVEVDGTVPYEVGRLTHSNRLYIHLPKTRLAADWDRHSLQVNDGRLGGIQVTPIPPDQLRILLDRVQGDFHIFTMESPYRIVIEILGSRRPSSSQPSPGRKAVPEAPPPGRQSLLKLPPPAPAPRQAPQVSTPTSHPSDFEPLLPQSAAKTPSPSPALPTGLAKAPTIVIDPGHGGHDPGAISPDGLAEKTVVLQVAKALREIISQELPQARVLLTRERDIFLPLKRRAAIANAAKADIFLSLHTNSSPQSLASGIETWYLSFAANDRAKRTASRENQMAVAQLSELETILRDLHEADRINESSELAGTMQTALVGHLGIHYDGIMNRGTDGAPFVVLLHTAMPSVLVEMAFLSNPRDADRLRTSAYHYALAQGLFRGVRQYLQTTLLTAHQ